MFDFPLKLAGF